MIKLNQDGAISGAVISLVLAVILLIAAIGFGAWAYSSMSDYKNNSDQKSAVAAEAAKQATSKAKDKQFAEEYKKPLKTYNGPDASGSLSVAFPKTWSGYVEDSSNDGGASSTLDGFFAPGVVPSASNQNSVFSLRVKVLDQSYAQVLQGFTSQQQAGKLSVSAYALPKLPKVVGVKVSGELSDGNNVTMVVLPLRSQTLQIWTEGTPFLDDFNNNILPNFSFSP